MGEKGKSNASSRSLGHVNCSIWYLPEERRIFFSAEGLAREESLEEG
jgi:hypothetical protein